jgi:hypothetical protein
LLVRVEVETRMDVDTRVGVETTGSETVTMTDAEVAGKTTTVNSALIIIHCFAVAVSVSATFANPNSG